MLDPLIRKPDETIEHLSQREGDRAQAFYSKHLYSTADLHNLSRVRSTSKPAVFMFQKDRCVKFVVKRHDNSSLEITSKYFPHMNPVDIFDFLKIYKRETGKEETIANRPSQKLAMGVFVLLHS